MTDFEQKKWNEKKETQKLSIEDLKTNINEKLKYLWDTKADEEKLAIIKEHLSIIKEQFDLYKNNEKALSIINNWLNIITEEILEIQYEWKQDISEITKNMREKLEYLERKEEQELNFDYTV